jgi:hypothetical protein
MQRPCCFFFYCLDLSPGPELLLPSSLRWISMHAAASSLPAAEIQACKLGGMAFPLPFCHVFLGQKDLWH